MFGFASEAEHDAAIVIIAFAFAQSAANMRKRCEAIAEMEEGRLCGCGERIADTIAALAETKGEGK